MSRDTTMTSTRFGLEAFDAGVRGRGVRATRDFERGEIVAHFGGTLVRFDRVTDFTHVLQVGPDAFLGPSGNLDDYVNHSCDPNTRVDIVSSAGFLVALVPIASGTEITFDYSTCMIDEDAIPGCLCGAENCRGIIEPFVSMATEDAERLERRGLVPAFARAMRRAVSVSRA